MLDDDDVPKSQKEPIPVSSTQNKTNQHIIKERIDRKINVKMSAIMENALIRIADEDEMTISELIRSVCRKEIKNK